MTGAPPPVPLAEPGRARTRLGAPAVELPPGFVETLSGACAAVSVEPAEQAEAGRDWWPLAATWAVDGGVPARPGTVARPTSAGQVADVLRLCAAHRVPVTPAGGRSGVCGAAVPVHGGVALDLTGLAGVQAVDETSLTVDVAAGTFGPALEDALRSGHGLTLGHWPQSVALSTVGGWLACRSAGQLSTRYGKIEDMVVGLEVALADGRLVHTGGAPAAAAGPDLTQLFVGSEGTLGVITAARLRVHPVPGAERRSAWGFPSFSGGLDACRRILRRGGTPAVLRLYDPVEAARGYHVAHRSLLLVLDEADPPLADAVAAVVGEECAATDGAQRLDDDLVDTWLAHRNDVSLLGALTAQGWVVDTLEVAAPWSRLSAVYEATTEALRQVPHVVAASAHQSHAYLDGACLYFSFGGHPPRDEREAFYVACWDAAQRAALAAGANLSHHHGVGLNRGRFARQALGPALDVLAAIKAALDPAGVLNPGKLGLPDPFGPVPWP